MEDSKAVGDRGIVRGNMGQINENNDARLCTVALSVIELGSKQLSSAAISEDTTDSSCMNPKGRLSHSFKPRV